MMTMREAIQRVQLYGASIKTFNLKGWRVSLNEWDANDNRVYITDDLEDAVLMAGRMRRNYALG